MNSRSFGDCAETNLDDELNSLEEAHCIAETVVVPGLLGYISIGKDNPLCIKKSHVTRISLQWEVLMTQFTLLKQRAR